VLDEACDPVARGPAAEMARLEILIGGAVAQHVPDGGEQGGSNGADRLLWAATLAQALELRTGIKA
jgi:hypothetical protein